MGVFSRTMLMLTLAWLVGLIITFLFLDRQGENDWRDRYIAEANIKRALTYRYVDLAGGRVAESATDKGFQNAEVALQAESIGAAPWGLPGDTASAGSTDALPGALIAPADSLIEQERRHGGTQVAQIAAQQAQVQQQILELNNRIAEANRSRRANESQIAALGASASEFAGKMESYRGVISSSLQLIFNMDYENQRLLIEHDALVAELAQVQNDLRRIQGQQLELEDSYYELSKGYEGTVKLLAWYEQADPNLRRMADAAGRGWLRGRVVGVGGDPRTGVVSISLGRNEGVFVGQTFSVFRGDRFLARLVVESVQPNSAVGRLQDEFRGRVLVHEGDSVRTSQPFGGATLGR
jgi:hypothetical protein